MYLFSIASIFGNQTGDAEELPVYNTETNSAGLINAALYAQLSDKYTKAEIDNLNAEINKAIVNLYFADTAYFLLLYF